MGENSYWKNRAVIIVEAQQLLFPGVTPKAGEAPSRWKPEPKSKPAPKKKPPTRPFRSDIILHVVGDDVRVYRVLPGRKTKEVALSTMVLRRRSLIVHEPEKRAIRALDFVPYTIEDRAHALLNKYLPHLLMPRTKIWLRTPDSSTPRLIYTPPEAPKPEIKGGPTQKPALPAWLAPTPRPVQQSQSIDPRKDPFGYLMSISRGGSSKPYVPTPSGGYELTRWSVNAAYDKARSRSTRQLESELATVQKHLARAVAVASHRGRQPISQRIAGEAKRDGLRERRDFLELTIILSKAGVTPEKRKKPHENVPDHAKRFAELQRGNKVTRGRTTYTVEKVQINPSKYVAADVHVKGSRKAQYSLFIYNKPSRKASLISYGSGKEVTIALPQLKTSR